MYGKRIKPGSSVSLASIKTTPPDEVTEVAGRAEFEKLAAEIGELQELLFAAGTHSVLIVLQGLDTSGKDGTIKDVLKDAFPTGCRVASFKVPSATDLAHDFLWRIHKETPERGHIVVFNRSHYEDVLVVRVHNLVPEAVWSLRYEQINQFEQLLTDTHTIVLKFFLHISKAEQEERLLEREQESIKAWKLSVGDWEERQFWDQYQAAYEDALGKCSTAYAPWYVIPADQKWFRNLAVSEIVVKKLRDYRTEWLERLQDDSSEQRQALAKARAEGTIPPPSKAGIEAAAT